MQNQTHSNLHPTIIDREHLRDTFEQDIIEGLNASPKATHPKHLYDALGSALFEQICELDQYYLTRTEAALLTDSLDQIATAIGPSATLIEPGAGSGEKAARILDALDQPAAFIPIEISATALGDAAATLAQRFPNIDFHPICADFTAPHRMPEAASMPNRVVFFPGSTIGNLEPSERSQILHRFHELAGPGGRLLIGTDLVKDPAQLLAAYDDRDGITARFNLNLLTRINNNLNANFDLNAFKHEARWNSTLERIEMHLVSTRDQRISVNDQPISFKDQETIHTESSHKFRLDTFEKEAAAAGFTHNQTWQDTQTPYALRLFSVLN